MNRFQLGEVDPRHEARRQMAKIKYGQIGVGHAHASKLAVYRRSSDYDVVGVVEDDPQLREKARDSELYKDLPFLSREQLLNLPDLKVVGVETRVRDLLENAIVCIDAGMHVHLDKPAGASLSTYKSLLDKASMQHLTVQMGYMYRYNPAILLLRELLAKAWLGDVFEVHAVMSKLGGPLMRDEMAEFAGGTMFELGCHIIDLVHGVLGAPDEIHAFPRHSASRNDTLNDNMLAVFEYPRATATVRTSVNEVEGFARRHLVVCGSKGTLHIQPLDNPRARLALHEARGKYKRGYQEVAFPKYTRYVADADDLAKIVRSEKDADFSYEHDYDVQRSVLLASNMPIT